MNIPILPKPDLSDDSEDEHDSDAQTNFWEFVSASDACAHMSSKYEFDLYDQIFQLQFENIFDSMETRLQNNFNECASAAMRTLEAEAKKQEEEAQAV